VRQLATHEDHVTMQDGRVLVMRNEETRPLEEEMTLPDGTRVMPNGQVLMSDGTARMMAEGETLMLASRMANAEHLSDRGFKEAMEDEELRDQIEGE
jgi:hypothetical protein